ncbi:MAG: hypothetical protein QXM77_00410 [Candidatus Nitrosocaldus sp.]
MIMESRPKPRLPKGFRYIASSDDLSSSSFSSNNAAIDLYISSNIERWVSNKDKYIVIVYGEKDVLGLMVLELHDDYIELAVLAKNYNKARYAKVGSRLAVLAESIARDLGKMEIRLEAMQNSHRWWNEMMHYEQYMPSYYDPAFGILTPKRKFLL